MQRPEQAMEEVELAQEGATTKDLSGKITGLTLTDLLSNDGPVFEGKSGQQGKYPFGTTAEIEIHCERHGVKYVTCTKLFNHWTGTECQICVQDRIAASEAKDRAEKEKRAISDRKHRITSYFKASGIPDRFIGKGFDAFIPTTPVAADISASCKNYAIDFPDRLQTGASLILCGHAGTGKSHLACAIAEHVINEHCKSAQFVKVARAIRTVKETYGRKSDMTEQEAINSFIRPDLLILDEVGVQFGSDTEKYILFEIINERYEAVKPTIMISNLALAGLSEFVGDRVIDRMKENGGSLLIFDWESKRGK